MATGKSFKSLGSSSSRARITKSVSKPKTTTTSKVSVPTKTSTVSLRKAATPSSSSGSSSSSSSGKSTGKSFAPVSSASNTTRNNITSAVNKSAASKSSTGNSSNAGKRVSSLTNASNSTRSKISSAVSSRSSGGSSSSRSSGGSSSSRSSGGSSTAKSVVPLVESSNEHRSNLTNAINDNISSKVLDNYDRASNANYTNAYNHLRSKGMSDEDANAVAAGLLENENLLKTKSDEEIAAEQWNNDDDTIDYMNDTINGIEEEGDEEDPYDYRQSQERQDLMGYIDDIKGQVDSLTSSNVIKTSVPEERDTSYDYNTYYQENLAPDNNYENGESKNTLNEKPQVTLVSQYQEPVSTALNDLGLLTPNEAVTNETPNAEEPDLPKGYENGEDIVTDFETELQTLGEENGTGLTPQAVAQTYSNFKNQLVQYANNNNLSKEEYEALLAQLKNNEILQNVLVRKQR